MLQKFILKHSKLLESVAKYTIAALLLSVPLYPKFPFIRIPGTFVSIRLEDILLVFSSFLTFIYIIPNLSEAVKNKVVRVFFPFVVLGLVSVLSAVFITQTAAAHIAFLHWVRRIEYFTPFFLAFFITVKGSSTNKEFYFKTILLTVFITFIYGLGQRYFSWPIIITQNEEYAKGVALRWIPGSHINSTFAGHYDLATYLVLVLPIIVSAFFILKGKVSKVILASIFFTGLWLLVNSASRISLVSYVMAASLSLMLIKRYKEIILIFIISTLFIGFSSNLLDRYQRIIEVSVKKFNEIRLNYIAVDWVYAEGPKPTFKKENTPTPPPVFEDRSTNIRLNVEWPRAIRAFVKNPLVGTGYSSITLATDNDYLRMLGEIGILGFMAFILIFMRIFYEFYKLYPYDKYMKGLDLALVAGYVGSLSGIFLNAVFIDIFEASKFATMFWLTTGLVLGLAVKNRRNINSSS